MAHQLPYAQYHVQPGSRLKLSDINADAPGDVDKTQAKQALETERKQMRELQALLYAESKHSLLIILQAMDTGGKDSTIRQVMQGINPQGVAVTSFKVPSADELAHDFLWRIHKVVPAKGMIGIFNRSHYEEVLVVRVRGLAPEAVWRPRFEQINQFEKYLADSGLTILKFYLHISKHEQRQRLQSRLDRPHKRWKFDPDDLENRALWGDYMAAYEEALERTSTRWAPWYVVPANHKWYRNLIVASVINHALASLDMRYPAPKVDPDKVVIPE